jgi:hypothetical protein
MLTTEQAFVQAMNAATMRDRHREERGLPTVLDEPHTTLKMRATRISDMAGMLDQDVWSGALRERDVLRLMHELAALIAAQDRADTVNVTTGEQA